MQYENDKVRLQQINNVEKLFKSINAGELLTVFYNSKDGKHDYYIHCDLIPNINLEESLSTPDRDSLINDFSTALIIDRNFQKIRPNYKELSENFRLFHNLYHDIQENKYIKIDNAGNEDIIATVTNNEIKIRTKEIREFLLANSMHLSIWFDCLEFSQMTLQELNLAETNTAKSNTKEPGEFYNGIFFLNKSDYSMTYKTYSRLHGKRLIKPYDKPKNSKPKREYPGFIIGVDDNGEHIFQSCNPLVSEEVYLTPVHFKKSVLDKYYDQSSKYSVEANILRCGALWSVMIDNHHPDKVCVWLGDLGRDLPDQEKLHWKSHNIAPVGTVSDIYYNNQILCNAMDSNEPLHVFKRNYLSLQDTCSKILGWYLILPLHKDDLHCLEALRIPSNNEQSQFDKQIGYLAKILVDSLNTDKLLSLINLEKRPEGSINILEALFKALDIQEVKEHIKFLRDIQAIRSNAVAHRKGQNYEETRVKQGMDKTSKINKFIEFVKKSNSFLEFLENLIKSNSLQDFHLRGDASKRNNDFIIMRKRHA